MTAVGTIATLGLWAAVITAAVMHHKNATRKAEYRRFREWRAVQARVPTHCPDYVPQDWLRAKFSETDGTSVSESGQA